MDKERAEISSKDRMEALKQNFFLSENPDKKEQGSMSLDLGIKNGMEPGYPQLAFINDPSIGCILEATELAPNDLEGYRRNRSLMLDEMKTFIQVAKYVAPKSPMTEALESKIRKVLILKHSELLKEVGTVADVIRSVSPKS